MPYYPSHNTPNSTFPNITKPSVSFSTMPSHNLPQYASNLSFGRIDPNYKSDIQTIDANGNPLPIEQVMHNVKTHMDEHFCKLEKEAMEKAGLIKTPTKAKVAMNLNGETVSVLDHS